LTMDAIASAISAITSNPSSLDAIEGVKWVGVVAYVLSTVGVTVGVYWEHDKFPKPKQVRGRRLLIWSLALDTFFTI